MIDLRRPPLAVVALCAVVLVVAGCSSTAASPSVGASPFAPASATIAPTTAPTPTPTAIPTPTPTASATPAASPSEAACLVLPQTGPAPSDRLTGIEVLALPGRDVVRFVFGNGSLTPVGPPTASISAAKPPFTEGASGRPIALKGKQALQVVFRGMSLQNDVGQPTFAGEREITVTSAGRSLRQVILFDESEGQVGWYVGYDTSSCLSLTREGDDLVLTIVFGPG